MPRQRNSKGRYGAEDDAPPTAETVAKLERDVLLSLTQGGILTVDHERAGREIARIWRALMRGQFGSFNPEGTRTGGAMRDPAGAMTEEEAVIHASTYLPWARAEAKRLVVHFPRLLRVDLAYRVCAANESIQVIAAHFGADPSAITDGLRLTLSAYEWRLAERKANDAREREKEKRLAS